MYDAAGCFKSVPEASLSESEASKIASRSMATAHSSLSVGMFLLVSTQCFSGCVTIVLLGSRRSPQSLYIETQRRVKERQ